MNNFLLNSISLIRKQFQHFLNKRLKEYNLKSSEILLLHILHSKGQSSQISLSKALLCDKSHTHRITNKLIEKGLVEFAQIEGQNKNHILQLTQTGHSFIVEIEKIIFEWNKKLKAGISEEEFNTLKEVVLKLVKNANQITGELI